MHRYHFFVRWAQAAGPGEFQVIGDVAGLPPQTVIVIEIPDLKIKSQFTISHGKSKGAQPLVLATAVLKPGQEALAGVTLRLPVGTHAGDYRLSIGQKAPAQLLGGVTLIARIT
jgi:hypothetical protein